MFEKKISIEAGRSYTGREEEITLSLLERAILFWDRFVSFGKIKLTGGTQEIYVVVCNKHGPYTDVIHTNGFHCPECQKA
jgi:hypothetical protein